MTHIKSFGFVGRSNIDFQPERATVSNGDHWIDILVGERHFFVKVIGEVRPGAKVTVEDLPEELLEACTNPHPGGGAFNTWAAFRTLATPKTRCYFLDSCVADTRFLSYFEGSSATFRSLCIRPLPFNLVLGQRSDKLILKPKLVSATRLSAKQKRLVAWLCRCEVVVVNSVVDEPVMNAIVSLRGQHKFQLHVVVTQSLAPDFLRAGVLSSADFIYAGGDEIGYITGENRGESRTTALESAVWLRRHAPRADVFITQGRDGVVVLPAESQVAYHVRLRPDRLREVQALVLPNPAKVCGCGDAFVAGACVEAEIGRSVMCSTPDQLLPAQRAAVSGCSLALRWLGYERPLSTRDFSIVAYPLGWHQSGRKNRLCRGAPSYRIPA